MDSYELLWINKVNFQQILVGESLGMDSFSPISLPRRRQSTGLGRLRRGQDSGNGRDPAGTLRVLPSLSSAALRDGNQGATSRICHGQEPEGQEHIPHPPQQPPHKYKTSNAQRSVGPRSLGKPPLIRVSLSWFLGSTLSSTAGNIHGTAIKLKIPARKTILNSSSDITLLNKKSRRNPSTSQPDFQRNDTDKETEKSAKNPKIVPPSGANLHRVRKRGELSR